METTKEKAKEIIAAFKEQVSWADKTIFGRSLNEFWVEFDDEHQHLYCPVHYTEALNLAANFRFQGMAQMNCKKPWLLIWGNPSDKEVEEIIYNFAIKNLKVSINTELININYWFIDPAARIFYHEYLFKIFEGVDFKRTYEALLNKQSLNSLIMEWD